MEYNRGMNNIEFFKAHALGNDFVLVLTPNLHNIDMNFALKLNHRITGIGCNQVLVCDTAYNVMIWNEDGTEANLCGNGLRCLAKLLHKEQITFHTKSGDVFLENLKDNLVSMIVHKPVEITEESNDVYQINIGNLHSITFVENLTETDLTPYINDRVNYSFLSKKNNQWYIRTMEANTNTESLACGSAALGAAYVLFTRGETQLTLHYTLGVITHEILSKTDYSPQLKQIGPATIVAKLNLLI